MTLTDLRQSWLAIGRPPVGRFNGRRVIGQSGAWVAVDSGGAWHLLVEIASGEAGVSSGATRGLSVTTQEMAVADQPVRPYVDLACVDVGLQDAFVALAADIITALAQAPGAPVPAVSTTLSRWRRFWSVPGGGLSHDAALGLFGEVWFLERWIGLPAGVGRWQGPTGSRHDFQWPDVSVEAKTTRVGNDGAASHRISGLDQLADPEQGQLWLFSLQVVRDALAANTLPGLIEHVVGRLAASPTEQSAFLDRVAQAGYSPAHAEHYDQTWRIVTEELYVVEGAFPRLTRASFPAGLPAGVREITYTLDLAACLPWRRATRPTDSAAAFVRA